MIAVGDPNVSRPHNPHVQRLRVPNLNEIDMAALRANRLARLQAAMQQHDIPICLFFNPANIRYVTGTDVMGVWTATTLARYCLLAIGREPVLFEYKTSIHVSQKLVRDVRPAISWQYGGALGAARARRWAESVRKRDGGSSAVPARRWRWTSWTDSGFQALAEQGIRVTDPSRQPWMRARSRRRRSAAHDPQRRHRRRDVRRV